MFYIFFGCTGLTSVTIPNSVTSIGDGVFYGCTGLTSITIPNSVTSISNTTFSGTGWYNAQQDGLLYLDNCLVGIKGEKPLGTVTINDGTRIIADGTFSNCNSLTSVTIPNSVITIGGAAFEYCTGLTSVTIPNSVTSIGGIAFSGCTGLTTITIPNSVTTIGRSAFKECYSLTSITIGDGINTIDAQAFASCQKLIDVYCYANNFPDAESDAFKNSNIEFATLHVPASVIASYKKTTPWSQFGNIVPLTDVELDISTPNKSMDEEKPDFYTLDGLQVEEPHKGINIIRKKDGTYKKIWVK